MCIRDRGNVDSRIRKIQSEEYDGIILAAAGLIRLNRTREITEYLDPDSFLPEIGQGSLAIQVRSDDHELLHMMKSVNHTPTFIAVTSERSFQKVIGGGCSIPVTAFSEIIDNNISVKTMAAKPDGSQIFTNKTLFDINEPEHQGLHAGGHASKEDIYRLLDIIRPQLLIPIHTLHPELMATTAGSMGIQTKLPEFGVPISIG